MVLKRYFTNHGPHNLGNCPGAYLIGIEPLSIRTKSCNNLCVHGDFLCKSCRELETACDKQNKEQRARWHRQDTIVKFVAITMGLIAMLGLIWIASMHLVK